VLVEGGLRRREDDHQALLDRGYPSGGHLWGGVAVVGADGAGLMPPRSPLAWWLLGGEGTVVAEGPEDAAAVGRSLAVAGLASLARAPW
jgi:hypothetical protein